MRVGVAIALITFVCAPLAEAKTRSRGEVVLSGRAFWPDAVDRTEDFGLALAGRVEFSAKQKGGWRQQLRVFGRAAALDTDRSIATLEEAWVGWRGDGLELRLGADLLNWTATDAFHPADIINARNFDGDIENAEKLGEPLFELRFRFLQGGLSAWFMPLRVSPRFPGPSSRLSLGDGARLGDALWVDRDGGISDDLFGPQWAVRFDQTFAGADLAIHYVEHNDRQQPGIALPILQDPFIDPAAGPIPDTTAAARPVFHTVRRVGGTYAHALGEWLVKLEADHRWFFEPEMSPRFLLVRSAPVDHTAVAIGLEWGWGYDESDHEATLLLEGQYNIAFDASDAERQQTGPFQRDVLLGYRHTFNDIDGTEFTTGLIVDTERFPELLYNFAWQQRLSDVWGIKGTLRIIHAPEDESFLHTQHEAHSVQLDVTRYF